MKTKKRIGRRKADAACTAVAVVPDVDLVKFADGVERVVDGWRCVDVEAFRAALALRGAGDNIILAYVRKLVNEISQYVLEFAVLVFMTSKLSRHIMVDRVELKANLERFVESLASKTKQDADYLRAKYYSRIITLQGVVRFICDSAFDLWLPEVNERIPFV